MTKVIKFSVIGDTSGVTKAVGQVNGGISGIGKSFSKAFGPLLGSSGPLGAFTDSLGQAGGALDLLKTKGTSVGTKMIGIGGAAAGAGVGLMALGSQGKQAGDQLKTAIEDAGFSYNDYKKQIDSAVSHQEHFGNSAVQTKQALQVLTQATGSPTKALGLLNTASDLAAAKHIGLSEAATKLGKVYNGNTKLLKEFGIQVTNTTKLQSQADAAAKASNAADTALAKAKQHLADLEAQDAGKTKLSVSQKIALRNAEEKVVTATDVANKAHLKAITTQAAATKATKDHKDGVSQLAEKLKGQAAASVDNFSGHLRVLRTEIMDHVEELGQKYGPALTGVGAAMGVLGTATQGVKSILGGFSSAQKTAAAATDAMSAAEDGAAVSEGLALGPILLIVAAVAAVIAIIYVFIRNWSTIWGTAKAVIAGVFNWIKANWPLLLAIITGPIGLAVLAIVKNWDKIKAGFQAVISFIANGVSSVVNFIMSIPGRIAGLVGALLGLAGRAGSAVFNGIKSGLAGIFAYFASLPSRFISGMGNIANAFLQVGSDIIHGIATGITNAAGAIGDAIKGVVKHIPGASLLKHVPGLGGFFGASGAIVTKPTMSLIGEAGPEALVPLSSAPGASPLGALGGGGNTNVNITLAPVINSGTPEGVVAALRTYVRHNGAREIRTALGI